MPIFSFLPFFTAWTSQGINAFQFANACWLSRQAVFHSFFWFLVDCWWIKKKQGCDLSGDESPQRARSYAVVTLPLESERFFPAYHDFALACFLGAAGVSQLSGPAAGLVSDHWVSRHGRRRPLMLAGTLVALPCIALQGLSREHPASWAAVGVYAASFFGSMLALNVIYAASAGLIPDLVRPDQVGQANGLMAAIMAAGACFGFVFAFAATSQAQLYVMYAALALVCIPTTLLCAQERPSKQRPGEAWTWAQLGRSYWISRAEHPAFFWLFVTRTCYYSGVSSQVFLQFYFRDCVRDHGQALKGRDPARWTAIMSFIGQVFACISAYPSARLSDRVGRKPLVAAACFGIASVYVAFCFVQVGWQSGPSPPQRPLGAVPSHQQLPPPAAVRPCCAAPRRSCATTWRSEACTASSTARFCRSTLRWRSKRCLTRTMRRAGWLSGGWRASSAPRWGRWSPRRCCSSGLGPPPWRVARSAPGSHPHLHAA